MKRGSRYHAKGPVDRYGPDRHHLHYRKVYRRVLFTVYDMKRPFQALSANRESYAKCHCEKANITPQWRVLKRRGQMTLQVSGF